MPKVRFEPDGIEIDVATGTTFLEAARSCDAQVGSACGGVLACSTCHVYVKEGLTALSEISEREEDIMDKAFDVRPTSRLGCQAKMLADRTYVIEVSRESRKAFLDEHPDIRNALAKAEAEAKSATPSSSPRAP
jgi:2Fe-2S ferredoxin